ncbi:TonB-dependent receptor plug domain-containing protein [Hydrocarboniphaga effusa]|uniref:TonB-dependent siderophore receptor n=2 Tax=Hydrocarboniphaga effusa TaxID=243629 RepID=UPI003BA9CA9B
MMHVLATALAAATIASHKPTHAQAPHASEHRQGLAATIDFSIPQGRLDDALDRFSEQAGLQIVYDAGTVQGRMAPAALGRMRAEEALRKLLDDSGLHWTLINGHTVAIRRATEPPGLPPSIAPAVAAPAADDPRHGGVVILSDIRVSADPLRGLPIEVANTSFGFSKSILETPRSVSLISQETIDRFGLSAIEDLVRVVPGTFTPTRFGIQGGIDVRSVPADTFFRGMKRLNLQGHAPTVLSAMDSIEVVRGPPSPIYGMGKIGGYTDMIPRSGRAADGSYLDRSHGRVSAMVGDYQATDLSASLQGPMKIASAHGGYHLFGMIIDSQTYARGVPLDASMLQGSVSVEDLLPRFRLEAGLSAQKSRSGGALIGRFTQELADSRRYIRGLPLIDLDLDHNGTISYREYNTASAVRGALSLSNQPLSQRWDWPLDADGKPLTVDRFPKVSGIPESMFQYLQVHPEADPGGLLRAQGIGGPLPRSGYVPLGFMLDPRTVGYDKLDLRRFAAFERDLHANLATAYIDLIDDRDPDFTMKNQLFFDGMDQYKISEQPFGTEQKPRIVEEKFTITRRLPQLPSWLDVNSLASINFRHTRSPTGQCFGDFSTHRTDAMADTWQDSSGGMTPNTTFTNCLVDSSYETGFPYTDHGKTSFSEFGLGVLLDVAIARSTNLLMGGRIDGSEVHNIEYAGTINVNTGTASEPGAIVAQSTRTRGWDDGVSWTFSLSHEVLPGVRPYFTIAQESLTLDNNANRISNAIVEAGHIGQSRLRELGLKASLLDDHLFFSTALYEQRRINVNNPEDPTITVEASSTVTRGWESEIKWVPTPKLFASFYALSQKTLYEPNRGGVVLIDARSLGFQDVVDPATGEVVYPAEAFLFGGRAFIQLPPGVEAYREKQGNPNVQIGASLTARLASGFGFTLSANHFSAVAAGRLQLIELPASTIFNAGAFYDRGPWQLRADVFNLNNERYFRARTGDTLADLPVSAMPDRRFQFTVSHRF